MTPLSTTLSGADICTVCKSPGCDLRLLGCGCTLHATCAPLSLILDPTTRGLSGSDVPVGPKRSSQGVACSLCQSGATVTGIQVLPLSFEPLKLAVELRKKAAIAAKLRKSSLHIIESGGNYSGHKRSRDEVDTADLDVEAHHVVLSQGKQGLATTLSDSDSHRTGRWTDEEVAFVDHLVSVFDRGQLPLPHETKLSCFLGEILLSKASRLTKKMKNAKLSTRSFELKASSIQKNLADARVLTTLQDRFIMTMQSEYSRLELRFNLSKQWRSFFSDLCVQVGYQHLDGSSYVASLEEFERLASSAEERMRNVRRRRMGLTLGLQSSAAPLNIMSSSVSQENPTPALALPSTTTSPGSFDAPTTTTMAIRSEAYSHADTGTSNGTTSQSQSHEVPALRLDEFDTAFMDFMGPPAEELQIEEEEEDHIATKSPAASGTAESSFAVFPKMNKCRDPFLEAIAMYLEKYNLPFQHADVWVPSFINDESDEEVHLLHAGYVTRRDQNGKLWSAFENFGEYSKSFSFTAGKGLVGRVYASGKTLWEFEVAEQDSEHFLRAEGAKEYGVRTATAIPFSTPGVGRMVVVLYSCNHIHEDSTLAHECAKELARYSPEPKWKLVIEIGDTSAPDTADQTNTLAVDTATVDHYSHGRETPLGCNVATAQVIPPVEDSPSGTNDVDVEDIISLLGEQLAIHSGPPGGSSSQENRAASLFHHFMSIRLMLLKSTARRSTEDNEMIDVLKNSYKSYSSGNRRSGSQLAELLAREWLCLAGPSSNPSSTERCVPPLVIASPIPSNQRHTVHELPPSMPPAPTGQFGGMPVQGMSAPPIQLSMVASKRPTTYTPHDGDDSIIVHDHSFHPRQAPSPFMTSNDFVNNTSATTHDRNCQQGLRRTVSCSTVLMPSNLPSIDTTTANLFGSLTSSKPRSSSFVQQS